MRCNYKENFCTYMYYSKYALTLYCTNYQRLSLKPKIMELVYIIEITFNINGITIHSTHAFPLNKKWNELKKLYN
jgi:hypothetical protein